MVYSIFKLVISYPNSVLPNTANALPARPPKGGPILKFTKTLAKVPILFNSFISTVILSTCSLVAEEIAFFRVITILSISSSEPILSPFFEVYLQ